MHQTIRKTVRIDTDEADQLEAYDAIINDPLCTVTEKMQEKLTGSEYNEEGKLARKWDRIIWFVTYERKKLL